MTVRRAALGQGSVSLFAAPGPGEVGRLDTAGASALIQASFLKVKMWQNVGLTFLVFVATLICVLLFMLCGWYVVWHLFLSKFKFLRELVCDSGSLQGESESSETPSDSDAPPSPQKQKPKSTRQRRIPAEEAT
ncbi:small integral membrane protein 13 [Xenopus laevis]|uniref:Small integral membrane protein 13 n=2 Tax=Xenopus laevis TaxID=8355 RepID=A0A1L8FY04_XENLA|nr:small integral membrane protein 13 [Xenopus laevis]OCT76448.1 hypothetical protein XELAEV_18031649mg [Xenopus laevis]